MRILISARSFGAYRHRELGVFEADQAKALSSFGHDLRIAALDTRSLRRFRPLGLDCYEEQGIKAYTCAVPASGLPGALTEKLTQIAAERLWQEVTADGWKPEIIHGHFGCAFAPIAKAQGIPFVYTEHFSGRNKPLPAAEAAALTEEYKQVDALIAVSTALKENIRRNTGITARVVPNIVDVDTFTAQPLSHEGFRIVTAANLVPIKALDVLLKALATLDAPDAALTIFGEGPEQGSLVSLSASLGISDKVAFRGACSREELAAEYARSDCFVLSSRSETFGLAGVEALAAGLPLIATRCGGPEDYISGENGILVPVDDPASLAAAMGEMIADAAAYDRTAIARTARERFSPGAVATELTAIYRELMEK